MGVTFAARRRPDSHCSPSSLAARPAVFPVGSAAAPARAKGHRRLPLERRHRLDPGRRRRLRFIFGKATEGITLVDPTYSINRAGTEGFGLRFGAYHFARPGGSSVAAANGERNPQADHFIDVAAAAAQGELPPVLDLEKTGGLKPANLQQWAAERR